MPEAKMDPAAISTMLSELVPFLRKTGIRIREIEPGRVVTVLPADPGNLNHIGTLHAGALFTLAETAGGTLVMSRFNYSKVLLVARSIEIHYLKPAGAEVECLGVFSEEEAETVRAVLEERAKADVTVHLKLTQGGSTEVARVKAVYHLKKLD